jgi:hypothetical protein
MSMHVAIFILPCRQRVGCTTQFRCLVSAFSSTVRSLTIAAPPHARRRDYCNRINQVTATLPGQAFVTLLGQYL